MHAGILVSQRLRNGEMKAVPAQVFQPCMPIPCGSRSCHVSDHLSLYLTCAVHEVPDLQAVWTEGNATKTATLAGLH